MWLDFVQESVSAEVDAMLEVVPQARQSNARPDIIEVTMNRLFPVRRQPTQNPIGFQLREIDVFTPVTPACDVIETTGQLDSQGTRHGRIVLSVPQCKT